VDSEPDSPITDRHTSFKVQQPDASVGPQYRYGRAQGETCASCSFSVPRPVADKLPPGAPGSVKADGKNKNGAPVFRSREFSCMAAQDQLKAQRRDGASSSHDSSTPLNSYIPSHRSEDCHDHTLTYLTAKSPEDPQTFAMLRASVIRTLSCELLPRGMSDGPLCFGDTNTGYTIAYVFRLTDPKARGRRRAYAFVALAGKDASRAFRACPLIWESFESMANSIEQAAQRHQDEKQKLEREENKANKRNYTPVSSFLTQRAVDPDGQHRRVGQTSPRSLAEIVGDENIFAILHQYFVALLKCLGDRFGGLPLADKPSVYQTFADDAGFSEHRMPRTRRAELVERMDKLRDDDTTPKPGVKHPMPVAAKALQSVPIDEIEVQKNKNRLSKTISLSTQCAPLAVSEAAQRQVVV
jgi:Vesicle coat protein involved in Golgi to plasma membrane transport